jgi:phosphoribosylaminoimidazolecarboxamide formyltransferase/IMP cyclohydrolase
MSSNRIAVRRALLSVSNKRDLEPLARRLAALGVQLLSTGGTARVLREFGLVVTDVSSITGFPEIMDGRVKTLHPSVHGGLLGRAGIDDAVMAEHAIAPIDLLIVNLYPFEATIARSDVTEAEAIEQIDIGGPAMLRAAAKNHARVAVVVDPDDYPALLDALAAGGTELAWRRKLAAKTYAHTARYDGRIADWLGAQTGAADEPFAPTLHLALQRAESLRYGENPHQQAALFLEAGVSVGTVAGARILQGKQLSFNNLADADAALECVKRFDAPACVIVKHANPCGVAVGNDLAQAYELAYACDPVSAFGGIIAFNRPLDAELAQRILQRQFVEVMIAPEVEAAALTALAVKPNVRVLASGAWPNPLPAWRDFKRIQGGFLVQDGDLGDDDPATWQVVSERAPSEQEYADMIFAWTVAQYVKSNAIVYARDGASIGIGAGQMSRVVSARIAAMKAEEAQLPLVGAAMASDAFLPFRDGVDAAAAVGIRSIVQPGGSIRDPEVIAAANEHGMAMVFTGRRHFRH